MTVRELREKLGSFPDDMLIIVHCNSEYCDEVDVGIVRLFHNRGYWSRAYRPEDKDLEKEVLVVS